MTKKDQITVTLDPELIEFVKVFGKEHKCSSFSHALRIIIDDRDKYEEQKHADRDNQDVTD